MCVIAELCVSAFLAPQFFSDLCYCIPPSLSSWSSRLTYDRPDIAYSPGNFLIRNPLDYLPPPLFSILPPHSQEPFAVIDQSNVWTTVGKPSPNEWIPLSLS